MNEVPVMFDVPSNKTMSIKGFKTITIKTTNHKKTHYDCFILACCADGTKLPPLQIFKRKNYTKR